MVFDVVLGSDFDLQTTGAIGVNEDEFADFLDNGRRAAGQDDASTHETAVRFRDLLGASRKTAQLLLERFDADGVTRRIGDERVLRASVRG